MAELTVETVTTSAGLARLAPEYARVVAASGCGLPFGTHEWQVAWWATFPRKSLLMEDRLRVKVVREGATCVGILPLVVTSRPRIGPVRSRAATLLGADPFITEIKTALVDPAHAVAVARALAADVLGDPSWDWIHWTGLLDDDPFSVELVRTLKLEPGKLPGLENFVLDLPATWDEFRKGLKRNIRESLRHCYNSLKRDGHAFELEVISEPAKVRESLATFHALHSVRAGLADTIEHPDRFASPASKAFLAAVCDRMAQHDKVRVFVLKIGGVPTAIRIGFVVGDAMYLYYSGYDPTWRKYSVMTTCVAEAIRWSIEHGLRTVNLSAGRDVGKTRWGARELVYQEALLVRDGLRSRLALRGHNELLKLKNDPRLGALVWRVLPRRDYSKG